MGNLSQKEYGNIAHMIFSGTNINKKGKYTDDSGYDPNVVDKQVGVFLLIDKIYTIG